MKLYTYWRSSASYRVRIGLELSSLPIIDRIDRACAELAAFQRAAPETQPDAEPVS